MTDKYYDENDIIVAFDKDLPPVEPQVANPNIVISSKTIYYEWNKAEKKWFKTNENDPDPNQNILPNGLFDGQIIEVTI